MIGYDNPNVNKAIENLIAIEMKKVDGALLRIGSRNIWFFVLIIDVFFFDVLFC